MSFWDLSDGKSAADNAVEEYEIAAGGAFAPIPEGSSVLALIDEAGWQDKDGTDYIELRWVVLAPDQYKNRKIFQKLWVEGDPSVADAKKAALKKDKAIRMLSAIDMNAGGKLVKKAGKPTNEDLMSCLTNKPMIIKLAVWEMDDKERPGETVSGNWICAVAPKTKGVDVKEDTRPAPKPRNKQAAPSVYVAADEIPF